MPLLLQDIVDFNTQSMDRINSRDDVTHPCLTPDFTVKLLSDVPTEHIKLSQNSLMRLTNFPGIL